MRESGRDNIVEFTFAGFNYMEWESGGFSFKRRGLSKERD